MIISFKRSELFLCGAAPDRSISSFWWRRSTARDGRPVLPDGRHGGLPEDLYLSLDASRGRHELNTAVAMFMALPLEESLDPLTRDFDRRKSIARLSGPIFQCLE